MALDFSSVGSAADAYRWKAIAEIIEGAITDGTIPPRGPVPSEAYIMQSAGVGRNTARRALADLRERGLVYVVPSLGTFAAGSPPA